MNKKLCSAITVYTHKDQKNINILYVLRYGRIVETTSFQIFGVDINLENTDNRTNKRSHFRTVVISPTTKNTYIQPSRRDTTTFHFVVITKRTLLSIPLQHINFNLWVKSLRLSASDIRVVETISFRRKEQYYYGQRKTGIKMVLCL